MNLPHRMLLHAVARAAMVCTLIAEIARSILPTVGNFPQRDDTAITGTGLDPIPSPHAFLYTDVATRTGGSVNFLSSWRTGFAAQF